MKKYNLHLWHCKNRTVRGKLKREVIKVEYYKDISFDLAKYLAVNSGCGLRLLDCKGEVCTNDDAVKAIGFSYWDNVIASIYPVSKQKVRARDSELIIHPSISPIVLEKKLTISSELEQMIENHEDNFFDYSIDANNIWGAKELIPNGFRQVTEGEIKVGDYYWDREGYWLSVDVSFSSTKIGENIEKTGMRYRGQHKGRIADELLTYFKHFVIRRNPAQ